MLHSIFFSLTYMPSSIRFLQVATLRFLRWCTLPQASVCHDRQGFYESMGHHRQGPVGFQCISSQILYQSWNVGRIFHDFHKIIELFQPQGRVEPSLRETAQSPVRWMLLHKHVGHGDPQSEVQENGIALGTLQSQAG